ncbi:choice-of-anchor D domain [Sphaerisporangium album]|uniref:Choice-of-anchor D domain n=1 Tax=Sphaerisporangium album TaxID=509200 RepID=A0A367F9N2_9ACTN|nr:choice-of-anchor D domain-containing protein [Sphaerisporangium album]RCG27078.1 choice-of-anchor D domain [Sphaerisporangium album]
MNKPGRLKAWTIATVVALTAGGVAWLPATPASAATRADSPFDFPGRGATVPFAEIEAEDAVTSGQVIGPDRIYTHLPSEASGRRAVTLDAAGEYVEFTLPRPANAMSLRYSVPDNGAGTGQNTTADLRVNGAHLKDLPLTSKYVWFYGGYPFNNTPGNNPHHFYDETRTMFGSTLAQGAKVRIQFTGGIPITVDLADFEVVPNPIARPAGSLSVDDYGAVRNGATDSTAAFQAAVNAGKAQNKVVWIPEGTYTLWDHVVVDGVTLAGAGPWYSVLTGRHPTDRKRAAGVYGKYVSGGGYTGEIRPHEAGGPSRNVTLKDFAIIGEIAERVDEDQVNAIGGAMSDSVVDNVWMQHTKVGAWMDGPMNNFVIKNSRILDQTADGVNFHTGVTNSQVTNTFVRNTGDDGLAMWPDRVANVNNSFDHNTVILPILANNIVTYGGRDIKITDNVASDTITNGGGIHIANRYPGVNSGSGTAVAGTHTVARNTLLRAGNSDYNWNFGVGAIWFDGLNEPINATINVSDTDILDSSYAAIHFIEGTTRTVNFTNVNVDGTGTYMIQAQAGATTSFTGVRANHIGAGVSIHNCVGTSFSPTVGAGNTGWSTSSTVCTGQWPAPNYIYPGGGGSTGGLSGTPGLLSFAARQVGTTSPAQTVTVTNGGTAAAPISGVSVTGDYAQTSTCGTSLAAGASCTVNVTFRPTATGTRTGTLTVASSAPGGPVTVDLTGAGTNGVTLSASPASLSFAARDTGTTSPAQAVTVTNTGSAAATLSGVTVTGDYAQTSTCGASLAAGASCTVNVTFTPTASGSRPGTLNVASNDVNSPLSVGLSGSGISSTTNLALGAAMTASSSNGGFPPGNANDDNTATYWESTSNAFPQWLQADLRSAQNIGSITLKLPPPAAWATRTQTLSVQGGNDGTTWTTLKPSAAYTFDPATGNTVTIPLTSTSTRYVRLNFTANTGWPAAQVAEFQIFPGGGSPPPAVSLSASPGSLSFASRAVGSTSPAQAVTVTNTGTGTANLGAIATTGDFAQTKTCGATLAAGASCTVSVTFTPTATGARTGTLSIASNAPGSPLTVALSGTGGTVPVTNLAQGRPTTETSHVQTYGSGNTVDGNADTYWESANNAFPQSVTVDLGSAVSVGRVVLKLPPAAAWATRTQTITVLGSTDGTNFTNVVNSATYTFNPATGNTATITFPATTRRHLRLTFTANSGWPAGQLSEFEVYSS